MWKQILKNTIRTLQLLALPTVCAAGFSGLTEKKAVRAIPDPARLDLSAFSEALCQASFTAGAAAVPEKCDGGIRFTGTEESRDPCVYWKINSMYKAAGYPAAADGVTCVPFSPEEKRVLVFKLQAEWGGALELFYTTGTCTEVRADCVLQAVYGGDSEFFGKRVSQYIILEADESAPMWADRFRDGFRLDFTNFIMAGDSFLLEKIAFCQDRAEADAFIAGDREQPVPVPEREVGYYVCRWEELLHHPEENVLAMCSSLEEAVSLCEQNRQYGYRVADEKGTVLYMPYSRLQCDLLREGRYITVYAKEQGFLYGDSCTNPAINHRPHRTSCDRLVDWILYRTGFTEQPLVQGCVVSNLFLWCEKMGFVKITSMEELQAGDIVFVRPDANGSPQHTFMLASDPVNGRALRYDHGSDKRIMSDQPTEEPVSYEDASFLFAWRPTLSQ